jgi:hypothetical protein
MKLDIAKTSANFLVGDVVNVGFAPIRHLFSFPDNSVQTPAAGIKSYL